MNFYQEYFMGRFVAIFASGQENKRKYEIERVFEKAYEENRTYFDLFPNDIPVYFDHAETPFINTSAGLGIYQQLKGILEKYLVEMKRKKEEEALRQAG